MFINVFLLSKDSKQINKLSYMYKEQFCWNI